MPSCEQISTISPSKKLLKDTAEYRNNDPEKECILTVTFWLSECQSLALQAFAVLGEGGSNCVLCDQVNYLLSLVVDLKDEVERLRSIKECEREIDCWYQTLSAPRSRQPDEALHRVSHSLPPCNEVTEGNQHADSVPAAVNPLSSAPPRNNVKESEDVGQWQKAPAR